METNGNEIEFADESRWGDSQWDELRVLRAEKLEVCR